MIRNSDLAGLARAQLGHAVEVTTELTGETKISAEAVLISTAILMASQAVIDAIETAVREL